MKALLLEGMKAEGGAGYSEAEMAKAAEIVASELAAVEPKLIEAAVEAFTTEFTEPELNRLQQLFTNPVLLKMVALKPQLAGAKTPEERVAIYRKNLTDAELASAAEALTPADQELLKRADAVARPAVMKLVEPLGARVIARLLSE